MALRWVLNVCVAPCVYAATKQRYAQQLQRVKALEAENLQLRQELEDVG